LVTPEEVVFVLGRAIRTSQAAKQEHSYSSRGNDGEQACVGHKPMNQALHIQRQHRIPLQKLDGQPFGSLTEPTLER
jgi:hypothetical protein